MFPTIDESPAPSSKVFEDLIGNLGKTYGVEITKSKDKRYDLFLPNSTNRIEVKITRLIENGNKSIEERFLPYGTGESFYLGLKQVKLEYFDHMIFIVVARNIALYTVFTREDVENMLYDSFVNREKPGFYAAPVHNAKKVPSSEKEREELLYKSEFNIHFKDYKSLKNLVAYGRLTTFSPRDVIRYLKNLG